MRLLIEDELENQISFDDYERERQAKNLFSLITDLYNIEDWAKILVPDSGEASSVAGEIARAVTRLQYRDHNDGDLFYTGYGVDTCGSSAQYLMEILPDSLSTFIANIAHDELRDDAYTDALDELGRLVAQYLTNHKELISTANNIDSRSDYELPEEFIPKYDFSCEIPVKLQNYLDTGVISEDDFLSEVYYWETGYGNIGYNSTGIHIDWDSLSIDGVDEDMYRALTEYMYGWLEQYADDLDETDFDEDTDESEEEE